MILEICAIVFTSIFALVSIFIILALISLRNSLRNVDRITLDVEDKLQSLHSSVKAFSIIGDACERQLSGSARIETPANDNPSRDIAEWIVLSIKLGEMFLNRR